MHFRLIRIPTSATIRIYRNVGERIELKTIKTFEPFARPTVSNITVPEVE
jgi:hypothetical protein